MKPYHPNNLRHQPYASWRVIFLAYIGKALGSQFHVYGLPFGSEKNAYRRPAEPEVMKWL